MNNVVGPKFILKSVFGRFFWVCEQYRGTHIFSAKRTNADVVSFQCNPNTYLKAEAVTRLIHPGHCNQVTNLCKLAKNDNVAQMLKNAYILIDIFKIHDSFIHLDTQTLK